MRQSRLARRFHHGAISDDVGTNRRADAVHRVLNPARSSLRLGGFGGPLGTVAGWDYLRGPGWTMPGRATKLLEISVRIRAKS